MLPARWRRALDSLIRQPGILDSTLLPSMLAEDLSQRDTA